MGAPLLPLMLRLEDRLAVVVGGGAVAARRVFALLECGARVRLVAPEAKDALRAQARMGRIEWLARAYADGDLAGAFLAVAATPDPAVNDAVAAEAGRLGALINRADDAGTGDVQFAAAHRAGPLTLAVHTGGASAAAAASLRDRLAASLEPDLARRLEALAAERKRLQENTPPGPAREEALRRLAKRLGFDS